MYAQLKWRISPKRFGKVTNKDVTLDLYKGEILSLLGENGSGKTTLMNMLRHLLPRRGQIYIDGQPVTIASPRTPLPWASA